MNAKKYGLVGLVIVAGLLATVLLVRLAFATPDAPADTPFTGATITGTVTFPDGSLPSVANPMSNTFVWLHAPDPLAELDFDLDAHGQSNVNPATGEFSFANIAPGRYILRAVPRDIPPFAYAPSLPAVVDVLTSNVSLQLRLTYPSVTGTVYAPTLAPTAAIVHVYSDTAAGKIEVERRWVWPENDGVFVVGGLPTRTLEFQAEPWPNDWYGWSSPQMVDVQPALPQYISLTLSTPDVFGYVVYQAGDAPVPVPDAVVRATASDNTNKRDITGWAGRYAIGNLPNGMVTLTVTPPPDLSWLQPPDQPITANIQSGTPAFRVITMTTPDRVVYGWVRTNEVISQPVRHALVQAHRVGSPGYNRTWTDYTGAYTLTVSPGLWAVSIQPVSGTMPGGWVYPREARLVQFDPGPHAQVKRLNFIVVMADATVQGLVRLPGNVLPISMTPPVTVTVSLHNDEGIGLSQILDDDGEFSLNVPHGTFKLDLRVESPLFAAPPPREIYAHPIAPTILDTITLLARNAYITGTVTDGSNSNPVQDVPVIAWNPDSHATFGVRANSDGVYVLGVYSGTWLVRPAPLPSQSYVYSGTPASVQALAHQVVNLNWQLTHTDAAIHGVLADESGAPVTDVRGWASAKGDGILTGAPVDAGAFDIPVLSGTYTVTLHLPAGLAYLAQGDMWTTTVGSNMTSTVTFTLAAKNSLLWGDVWNVRTGMTPLADVDGVVWAWDDGMWTGTDIKVGNLYRLPVPAGEWRVNYAIDPDSDYIKTAGPRTYAVPSSTVQYVPLPVARKDGTLNGTVVLSDGVTPARGAIVIAEAISADIKDVRLSAPVDLDGQFTLALPHGLYNVRSVLLHNDWRMINPRLAAVSVPRNGAATVTLHYRRADAFITGAVTLENPPSEPGPTLVYGWTPDDGYNVTIAVNGVYTLPVLQGMTWKLAAVSETLSQYWITRTAVTVPTGTPPVGIHQDLALKGPKPKPAPVTVLFDASQAQYIELSDGTRIFVPAGAMPVTGNVILHITPIANAIHHRNGDVMGLSYVFEAFTEDGQPITQHFNQDVVIVLMYDPNELAEMGLEESKLKPAYFSTTTNSWTIPDSYVVDEEHREITLQIDHFTRFGVVAVNEPYNVFLPVVMRNATN